jgi:hypothetical protein
MKSSKTVIVDIKLLLLDFSCFRICLVNSILQSRRMRLVGYLSSAHGGDEKCVQNFDWKT